MLVKRGRVRVCRLQRPKGINSGPEHWRSAGLPDDMVLIPGVIDSVANFVERSRLVAQRLRRFVDAVGPSASSPARIRFRLNLHQHLDEIVFSTRGTQFRFLVSARPASRIECLESVREV
jgi:hypothetical protein